MIPWETIEAAVRDGSPNVDEALSLHRRGEEFSIRLRGVELMNSRRTGSERALATRAAGALEAGAVERVAVGGLGMGFTAAAALECFPRARVWVAEISPRVVAWNRGPLGALAGEPMADARSELHLGDLAELLRDWAQRPAAQRFDAILLDTDNGPETLSQPGNDFYSAAGLASVLAALAPGGALGVWSAGPDPAFERRLRRAGCHVEAHRAADGNGRSGGARRQVWIAQRARR